MLVMLVLYTKLRRFVLITVVFLFSLVIGMMSIQETSIPFSPYIQIFFLLFQTIIFLITSLRVYQYGGQED